VGEVAGRAARDALIGAIVLQAALFVLALVIVALPPIRLALTPRAFKRDRVRRRALEQFAAKNLHLTRDRTGVLIFVSFGEHMAELIADDGIAGHVEPHVWDQAMGALVEGLKRGEAGAGLAAAVRLCGEVLAERFPARGEDNPNELPNAVVILPRA
jgi:putative membrane protein